MTGRLGGKARRKRHTIHNGMCFWKLCFCPKLNPVAQVLVSWPDVSGPTASIYADQRECTPTQDCGPQAGGGQIAVVGPQVLHIHVESQNPFPVWNTWCFSWNIWPEGTLQLGICKMHCVLADSLVVWYFPDFPFPFGCLTASGVGMVGHFSTFWRNQ